MRNGNDATVVPPRGEPTGAGTGRTRWYIVGLIFIATFILYIDRGNLGVAAPHIREEMNINDAMMGVILSAFFWTYALMQIPVGLIIDKLGPRITYAFAAAWWSLFTAATALANGFGALLGLRLALGVGESPAYPTNAKVVSEWFPRRERAFAAGIFESGAHMGAAVSTPLLALLIAWVGWRGSFAITGLVGLLWPIAWFLYYRHPRSHRRVSRAELRHIEQDSAPESDAPLAPVRWSQLLRHRSVWGLLIGFFSLNFVVYFFITWFPSYLVDARGFDLLELGLYGSIPPLCAVVSAWLGGRFSGFLIDRGYSLSISRKLPIVVGLLLSSSISLAVLAPTAGPALALLSLAYASITFTSGSIWSLSADLAPSPGYVGTLAGLQNFAANLGGISSPLFVGFMLQLTGGDYVFPLVAMGVVSVIGALSYLLVLGKVEPLPAPAVGSVPTPA